MKPYRSFVRCCHQVVALAALTIGASAIAQDAAFPTVTLYAPDPHASETGPDPGLFLVRRVGPTNFPLLVFYQLSGSASNGVDYGLLGNTVQVPAGAVEATFTVKPIDDDLVEGEETVIAQLTGSPLLCATCGYNIGVPSNAVVVIADNDAPTNNPPEVNLYASDDTGREIPTVPPWLGMVQGSDPLVFTVTRSGPTDLELTVFFEIGGTAKNGVDYFYAAAPFPPGLLPGHATIPAGASSVDIELLVIDDYLVEGTETVELTLRAPLCVGFLPPIPGCYVTGTNEHATGYILDNDEVLPPIVTVVATDPEASETGPDPGRFTVSRNDSTNYALGVFYTLEGTAHNGVDYVALSNLVIIPAGASSADIVVTPIDDAFAEGTETVRLQLRTVIWPDDLGGAFFPTFPFYSPWPWPYILGVPSNAVVTVADNDLAGTNLPPQVRVVTPLDGARFVGPTNILLGADAVDRDGSVTQVEFFEGDHSLGLAIGPLRTPFGMWLLNWSNVVAGHYTLTAKATDNLGALVVSAPVHISVVTNPPPPPPTNEPPSVGIVARDPFASEGTNFWLGDWFTDRWTLDLWNPWHVNLGGTNTATFVVRRHGPTNEDLTVYFSIGGTASNGVDYAMLPGSVSIPAGRHTARIVVVPIDDTLVEGIETVVLALLPDANYGIGFPPRAAAIILDNDQPRPPCVRLSDHQFHLCWAATNGFCFRVEASVDLLHWVPVCTNVVTESAVQFVDPDAPAADTRFYRVLPESGLPPDDD